MKEKNRLIGVGMCVLLLLAIIPVTASAVPSVINYQGYLTDAGGNPINGDVAITFRMWSAEVAGTEVWSESHAAVAVNEGVFNVLLGSFVPISAGILEGNRWLGMAVGTDGEMTPRMKVTSVAYAIRAGYGRPRSQTVRELPSRYQTRDDRLRDRPDPVETQGNRRPLPLLHPAHCQALEQGGRQGCVRGFSGRDATAKGPLV